MNSSNALQPTPKSVGFYNRTRDNGVKEMPPPASPSKDLSSQKRSSLQPTSNRPVPTNSEIKRHAAKVIDTFEGYRDTWRKYKHVLAEDFNRRSRAEQENLVKQNCTVITMGMIMSAATLIYRILPLMARVWGMPALFVGSFLLGRKLVTPIVIKKLDRHLKSADQDNAS